MDMVLASHFENLVKPYYVILAIPLAELGSFVFLANGKKIWIRGDSRIDYFSWFGS